MISTDELRRYLLLAFPDAEIAIGDRTGTGDHFIVHVGSSAFEGMSLLNRQREVYKALSTPMQDGRIHALEIKTQVKAAS